MKARKGRAYDLVVTRWGARLGQRRLVCAVGRGGICRGADKREGDGASPAGVHRLMALLYRADRGARPKGAFKAQAIGPSDLWSDDPTDPRYNQPRRAPSPFRHERLRRGDRQYDLLLVSDWNAALPGRQGARPGAGSAIFLHLWRKARHPTAGCIALARRDFLWLLTRLSPRAKVVVRR